MATQPALDVQGLTVKVRGPRSPILKPMLTLVEDISLDILPGETVGLVGESGSGKSTVARGILRLIPVAAGRVVIDGVDFTALGRADLRRNRNLAQIVFQDPFSSINPSMLIREVLDEPLLLNTALDEQQRYRRVQELLVQVGLNSEHADRFVHEFSGGQRQRIAIARALAVNPKVLLCDEPVSSLDVSTQSQIIALLQELQAKTGVAILFISHGLALVRHITSRVVVMYGGRVVETGPTEALFSTPQHPYTKALLDSMPSTDPKKRRLKRKALETLGEAPSVLRREPGCVFVKRCPLAFDRCRVERPELRPVGEGRTAACHLDDPYGADADVDAVPEPSV